MTAMNEADAVELKLAAMRTGNAHGAVERDLSLVKGEYWQTRRVAVRPHHFRRDEFERYLREERFPMNTIEDRVRVHTEAVRQALVRGVYVPQEVMKDEAGIEALELALMDVMAQAEGARRLDEQKVAVEVFEKAIGYTVPNGEPERVIRRMLIEAAKAVLERCGDGIHRWACGGYKRIKVGGHPRELLVGMKEGINGAMWLEFRDSGWPPGSLYGEVHRMSCMEAEGVYIDGILDGDVTQEEAASVMGTRWRPFMRVSVASSC